MNNNSQPIRRVSFLPHFTANFQESFWPFGEMVLFKTNHLKLLEVAEDAFGRFPKLNEEIANPLVLTLLVINGDDKPKILNRIEPRFVTQGRHFFISLDQDNVAVADIFGELQVVHNL
jgi:hypothetical protein